MNPILGDLYGYSAGSSTWIFHTPSANGAAADQSDCASRTGGARTLFRAIKTDVELAHVAIHERDLVI